VKGTVKEVRRQYIAIKDLLQRLANIDVRHVFVILDSCKSGLSLAPLTKSDRGGDTAAAARDLMSRHSRRVMSSAMGDQNASDMSQHSPKNSRFTGWLVDALERALRGEAPGMVGDDGMVTSTELFDFVRERVAAESNKQQMPDFGRFDNDRSGELVLTLEHDPFEAPFTRAVDAFNRGDFGAVPEAVEEALRVRRDGFGPDFLRYLLACIPGREDHGRILASLRAMSARIQAGEPIPAESGLSKGSLIVHLSRAETICQKTACTVPRDGR
jgi:hypothetical protein